MRAVVTTGGKQYCVAQGDKINVEKLSGEAGDTVTLQPLMVGDKFGAGSVQGKIIAHGRGDKVIVFKKKRRQNYRRKNGHRQDMTLVEITSVSA